MVILIWKIRKKEHSAITKLNQNEKNLIYPNNSYPQSVPNINEQYVCQKDLTKG